MVKRQQPKTIQIRNMFPEDPHFAKVRAKRAAVKNQVYHACHGMVNEIHGHFPVFSSGGFITVLIHNIIFPPSCEYTHYETHESRAFALHCCLRRRFVR